MIRKQAIQDDRMRTAAGGEPPVAVRIVSPSGVIDPAFIDAAADRLRNEGFAVSVDGNAGAVAGRYAGSREQRIAALQAAMDDEELDVILCSRGGYGLVQIVDSLDFTRFVEKPKWLVGFSDITVLHNALSKYGIPSIHGPMVRHLAGHPADSYSSAQLLRMLRSGLPTYRIAAHPLNRQGSSRGRLVGGNLSVLAGLRGTPYDLDYAGAILFIEDIAEQAYHIDRMLQNLRLGGVFAQLAGLIVGHFTDCADDASMGRSLPELIRDALEGTGFPVCFGFPAGHEDQNYPLVLGREIGLTVTGHEAVVDFS
ncbi:MAG: LD-carboxypeptidase [Bacteroidales bacterium]|jgi:muramoyltetrapeptide carboxypeptidase|nr:LD-carboxypeptidase [Bacteroidales bacterium]